MRCVISGFFLLIGDKDYGSLKSGVYFWVRKDSNLFSNLLTNFGKIKKGD